MSEAFDAIVIGGGQAGPSLAVRLAQAGKRVAVIERKLLGGTCVNTGCKPTKTMVASAYAARMAQRAADYGVTLSGSVGIDLARVMARKDKVSTDSRQGLEDWLNGTSGCELIYGHARFRARNDVDVGGRVLSAPQIFLNVGGRASVPALPGVDQVRTLTNSSILALEELPSHLVVVGGSYIGLEFAQMFRRFGSEVTVVEKGPRLTGREDEDVSEAILQILRKEDINFRLKAECIHFAPHKDGVAVGVNCDDGAPEVIGSHGCLPWGGDRIPTILDWKRRASRRTSAATSASTTNCGPVRRASGLWGIAMDAGRSPTPRTTTTRSWRPICSTATRAGWATGYPAMRSTPIRHSGASA